jgi:Major tropism determinant N-terminal domain
MSKVLRLRRGSTTDTANFTGALAEVTVDTTKWSVVVHDNVTPGGHALATESFVLNNQSTSTVGSTPPTNAQTGGMWYDNVSGRLYVYYANAWVDASPVADTINIGNISIEDNVISSVNTDANIYLSPNGAGNVSVQSNLHIENNGGIYLGSNNDIILRVLPPGFNGNPYARAQFTTSYAGGSNTGISITAANSSMFFNPETSNIGINNTHPGHTFTVNGAIGSNTFVADSGDIGSNIGYGFSANAHGTGMFHVLGNTDVPSAVEIAHDGLAGLRIYSNGFVETYDGLLVGSGGNLHVNNIVGRDTHTDITITPDSNANVVISGNLLPVSSGLQDFGATGTRWRDGYFSRNLMINGHSLSVDNSGRLTIDGLEQANGSGALSPSTSTPGSAAEGTVWYDTGIGHLFVRYQGTWVDITATSSDTVAPPVHSTGSAGDVSGLHAYDSSHIYYCTGTYDGTTNIWKRVAWSNDTW